MIKEYRKCIFCVVHSGRSFLLLHRKLNWKGWEFCKGGIHKNERAKQAAKREIREETGLKLMEMKKLSYYGKFPYPKEIWKQKRAKKAHFVLFSAEVKKGRVKISKKEHDGYRWCSLKQALKLLTYANQRKCLKIAAKFTK